MKHYLLYGYGGACNHGSEASAKSEIAFLRKLSPGCRITLSSHFPDYDQRFGVQADEIIGRNPDGKTYEEIYTQTIQCITPETICLSVGGDIYCYSNWERYAAIHYAALERGAKSFLWRCSLDESSLTDEMLKVVKSHHLITPRESVTFRLLKDRGVSQVVQSVDMAFLLPTLPAELPPEPYVAINLSPLILRKNPQVQAAYQYLIDQIVAQTTYDLAFVPHVEIPVDSDVDALSLLKAPENRLFRVPIGLKSEQYKYILSKAELCVTARTHVAIAAWGSGTPTLVMAYSTKARGIAEDLGQDSYALPVEDVTPVSLWQAFSKLYEDRTQSRQVLGERVTQCVARADTPEILAALT